jgi:hypothetical protein
MLCGSDQAVWRSSAALWHRARRTRRVAVALLVGLLVAPLASTQSRRGGGSLLSQRSLRFATTADFDGGFQFCRIVFRTDPNGDGNGWSVDWPRADANLSIRLSELSRTPVSLDPEGQPRHLLVRLTDPALFRCPFAMMTEPGGAYLDDQEAAALRTYLLKGGFLWADDFWGSYAWTFWETQLRKALPAARYPIVDVQLDHPILHLLLPVTRIPQIPGIRYWAASGGGTSERGRDSAEPHMRAVTDDRGRILVLMTHNTDFGDAFEEEATDHDYFLQFSVQGYAVGVNTIVYALTH